MKMCQRKGNRAQTVFGGSDRVKNESAPDSRELSISATGTSLGRKSGSCVIGREALEVM
jgi:hypothetical protein